MVPKLLQLRSCCEAIENVAKTFWHNVAKTFWHYPEVAKMFDAVAMLLRNRYKAVGVLIAKPRNMFRGCADAAMQCRACEPIATNTVTNLFVTVQCCTNEINDAM